MVVSFPIGLTLARTVSSMRERDLSDDGIGRYFRIGCASAIGKRPLRRSLQVPESDDLPQREFVAPSDAKVSIDTIVQ